VKLPRDLSARRVVAALKRLGFVEDRQKGSHIRLSKGHLRITVPNHPSLAPKTLQSIIKQAGITLEELTKVI
jgi:predicted RNA binding protein YcfA (HicA-like mRNA interferase family)